MSEVAAERPAAVTAALVSVIVPTYHRPALLRKAVASVLAQRLPPDTDLEVVVGVSDAASEEDRAAAAELAASDPRVRAAVARRPFPGEARNAAIEAARGSVLAFIDDDCEADPGWLAAALRALESADIVQGRTAPDVPLPRFYHTVWVSRMSWLWETCNLVVRRDLVDRVGGFGHWNPGDDPDFHPFGEDVEWGWRLIRAGGRATFAADAVVHHVVEPRSRLRQLRDQSRVRYFSQLFRTTPEARRHFYRGYLYNRRHAVILAAAGVAGLGMGAGALGRRRVRGLCLGGAAVLYLSPLRGQALDVAREAGFRLLREGIELGSCAYGSARWRRLVL